MSVDVDKRMSRVNGSAGRDEWSSVIRREWIELEISGRAMKEASSSDIGLELGSQKGHHLEKPCSC